MKKMNKMYEAPKAEVVELNVNKDFMDGGSGNVYTTSFEVEQGDPTLG
jgi:hypothetical protein